MTPNRRAKIEAMLNALESNPSAQTFRTSGGSIRSSAGAHVARYAGVSTSCTHSDDKYLIKAWVRIARRKIAVADFLERRP